MRSTVATWPQTSGMWTMCPRAVRLHPTAAAVVPLGEAGRGEDIADGVLYLAADASRHVTGSEPVIDGGMTAGRVTRFQG